MLYVKNVFPVDASGEVNPSIWLIFNDEGSFFL